MFRRCASTRNAENDCQGDERTQSFARHEFYLVLNVFVKQFDFVSLLADFDPEQIAYREHSDPAVAVDDRQVTGADPLHSFEGLVGSFITLDHGA